MRSVKRRTIIRRILLQRIINYFKEDYACNLQNIFDLKIIDFILDWNIGSSDSKFD